jgi:hypothetical protein
MVVRLYLDSFIGCKTKELVLEQFEKTKKWYESEDDEWYQYLLNYMKLEKNAEGNPIVMYYVSRFEGDDDFLMDLPTVQLYSKEDLLDACEKKIVLELKGGDRK